MSAPSPASSCDQYGGRGRSNSVDANARTRAAPKIVVSTPLPSTSKEPSRKGNGPIAPAHLPPSFTEAFIWRSTPRPAGGPLSECSPHAALGTFAWRPQFHTR